MLPYLIFGVCIVGLVYIFMKRHKFVNHLERMKASVGGSSESEGDDKSNVFGIEEKKKTKIDYQAISDIFNKADVAFSKGDYSEAQKGFIRVLSMHPDHVGSNYRLALIYLHQDIPSKADVIFRHLIKLEPKNPNFYIGLAKSVYKLGDRKEAAKAYEMSVVYDPKNVDSFVNLGRVYVELGKNKEAVNAFSKALTLNPRLDDIYFVITDLLIELRAYDEAMACMETYLESSPYSDKAKENIRQIKILKGTSPLINNGKKDSEEEITERLDDFAGGGTNDGSQERLF